MTGSTLTQSNKAQVPRELANKFIDYHHIKWYVGNARQAADMHTSRMGFRRMANKSLSNGKNRTVHHEVVKNGRIIYEFISPIRGITEDYIKLEDGATKDEMNLLREVVDHVQRHGDSVKDIAIRVSDIRNVYEWAVSHGAESLMGLTAESDSNGTIVTARVKAYGDVVHTLVDTSKYNGPFLPGYIMVENDDPLNKWLPPVDFEAIDHTVGNQTWGGMSEVCQMYSEAFGFHKYESDANYNVKTENTALLSTVMLSENENIKMPINEPGKGQAKSQIAEYIAYNDGPGVQHIALRTKNIVGCVLGMIQRGMGFLDVPDSYYDQLRKNIKEKGWKIQENVDDLQKLKILVDFDEKGYLLQLFVKEHMSNRPTIFYEIIQRGGSDGFGGGNFAELYKAVEREQAKRGNLN
ncbi:Glyoxalase/Bleomycin resistance protein/Dihydroxybiphenyl dioxygenase [Dipodascopsis uninucleata]